MVIRLVNNKSACSINALYVVLGLWMIADRRLAVNTRRNHALTPEAELVGSSRPQEGM